MTELASDESARRVFSLLVDGVTYYPAELLKFSQPDATAISQALARMDAASKFIFIMRAHDSLGGLTAAQSVARGDLSRVIALAQAWALEDGVDDAATRRQ